jgi:hypothetical protein
MIEKHGGNCYFGGMKKEKAESNLDDRVSPIEQGRCSLTLMLSSYKAQIDTINELVIRQAVQSPIWVLDMGNCFNPLRLTRQIRSQTLQIHAVLDRIHVARAFTCFQVISLLGQTKQPKGQVFILDLLTTFADEVIPAKQRIDLLHQVLAHISRLKQAVPVLLTTGRPGSLEIIPDELLNHLKNKASQVVTACTMNNTSTPRLF